MRLHKSGPRGPGATSTAVNATNPDARSLRRGRSVAEPTRVAYAQRFTFGAHALLRRRTVVVAHASWFAVRQPSIDAVLARLALAREARCDARAAHVQTVWRGLLGLPPCTRFASSHGLARRSYAGVSCTTVCIADAARPTTRDRVIAVLPRTTVARKTPRLTVAKRPRAQRGSSRYNLGRIEMLVIGVHVDVGRRAARWLQLDVARHQPQTHPSHQEFLPPHAVCGRTPTPPDSRTEMSGLPDPAVLYRTACSNAPCSCTPSYRPPAAPRREAQHRKSPRPTRDRPPSRTRPPRPGTRSNTKVRECPPLLKPTSRRSPPPPRTRRCTRSRPRACSRRTHSTASSAASKPRREPKPPRSADAAVALVLPHHDPFVPRRPSTLGPSSLVEVPADVLSPACALFPSPVDSERL